MAYHLVGDVHGCLDPLKQLLEDVKEDDTVVFCGDLVDRGPDSVGVVKYAFNLPCKKVLVQGNHEKKHLRFWDALFDERRGPEVRAKLLSRTPELLTVENGLTDDEKLWIRRSPYWYRLPGNNVVVHAGFPETITELPETEERFLALSSKQRRRMQQLLHVRNLSDDGHFVPLNEDEERGKYYWAEKYDGRFGFAWSGHHPHFDGDREVYPHACPIDTGAVYGGYLTAAILSESGVHLGFKRVPSKQHSPFGLW